MAYNNSSKLNILAWLTYPFIGLLAFFFLDKRFKRYYPKLFEAWDTLPISSQESWKRFWIVILGTSILFITVAGVEQTIQPKTHEPPQLEQSQVREKCPIGLTLTGIYCLIIESELLKLAETFSIVVASWIFILDRQDRREQAHREDWSLIDGARGVETSGARFSAIERLHRERISLKGLDAEAADLRGIELESADLERSNLQKADLQEASLVGAFLEEANLQEVNLENANLEGANLRYADLRGAKLTNANLKNSRIGAAKLHRAILRKADLEGANLKGSRFYDTDFRGANLRGANIAGAEFARVKYLTFEQIKTTINWKRAKFSQDVLPDNPDIPRKESRPTDVSQQSELKRKSNELREIENIIDEISQKTNLSKAEFNKYLKNNSFGIPEVDNLRELLLALEDLQENKKQELDDLIEDLNQELGEFKQENETQQSD